MKIKELIAKISPILITPSSNSLTISISTRFFLFRIMERLIQKIEEDPELNFIALLKSYKILGKFLHGTLHEFYRDRNKLYFKKFFIDHDLYEMIKKDIESLYPKHKDIKITITKRGIIIYENYKKNSFNVLLMTIHSGTWVPKNIEKKMSLTEEERFKEEDIATDIIYRNLVLEKAGIWIDNKQSRFVIDFNRSLDRAIYADNSEEWLNVVWKEPLTRFEKDMIYSSYREFYFTLSRLLDSYQFNIIFDGHSMKDKKERPAISFGTKFIPEFYLPIVRSMQQKMIGLGYSPVLLNTPYEGGNILHWLSTLYPNVFIFSMEINKRLYLRSSLLKGKINKISDDLMNIFEVR